MKTMTAAELVRLAALVRRGEIEVAVLRPSAPRKLP